MNATVTLPIGELDNLRNEITNQSNLIKEYEKNKKKVEILVKESVTTYESSYMSNSFGRGYGAPYVTIPITKEVISPPTYIGFEEVIEELKKEAESKVIEKIGNLNREVIELKETIQKNSTEYNEKIVEIRNRHQKEKNDIIESYNNQILTLNNEIKTLNGELVDLGKDEMIKKLTEQLEEIKNKTFLQRLFNL